MKSVGAGAVAGAVAVVAPPAAALTSQPVPHTNVFQHNVTRRQAPPPGHCGRPIRKLLPPPLAQSTTTNPTAIFGVPPHHCGVASLVDFLRYGTPPLRAHSQRPLPAAVARCWARPCATLVCCQQLGREDASTASSARPLSFWFPFHSSIDWLID